MERELTLRIVLEGPPAGVDFGLQKGRGSIYETVQKQRSETGDLCFEVTVGVKAGGKGGMPDFVGPMVQGKGGERFVYIDIGTCAGQTETCWSRRLKIPLSGIPWAMVEKTANGRMALEARVAGTGRDGGPNCGSVRDFDGWELAAD